MAYLAAVKWITALSSGASIASFRDFLRAIDIAIRQLE
jgi:hypothetical protein